MEEQIVSYSIKLPKNLLKNFKIKCHSEGYTVQEAINILIKNYTEGE